MEATDMHGVVPVNMCAARALLLLTPFCSRRAASEDSEYVAASGQFTQAALCCTYRGVQECGSAMGTKKMTNFDVAFFACIMLGRKLRTVSWPTACLYAHGAKATYTGSLLVHNTHRRCPS
jgi:hypothetical protein